MSTCNERNRNPPARPGPASTPPPPCQSWTRGNTSREHREEEERRYPPFLFFLSQYVLLHVLLDFWRGIQKKRGKPAAGTIELEAIRCSLQPHPYPVAVH